MLNHNYIARMLDYFESADFLYVCMEYLSGGTLPDYLERYREELAAIEKDA